MSGQQDDGNEPATVSPEDWQETERWLDEWTQRATDDGGSADDAAAPPTSPPGSSAAPPVPGAVPAAGSDAPAPVATDPAPHQEPQPVAAGALPAGYAPPASPAYAAGGRPGQAHFVRSPPPPRPAEPSVPAPPPPPPDEGLRAAPMSRTRERAGHLLFAGLALAVVALASAALLSLDGDDGPDPVRLGEVGAADAGATVRTGSRTTPLEAGATIAAGDVVQAPSSGAVSVDLGGGVVRFDSGASVTFIDDGVDPETGELDGDSQPVLEVLAGRTWVNPSDGTVVEVRLPGGRATSAANPLAIECPGDCALHAPAAGVDIDSDSGGDAAPSPAEIVTLRPDGSMSLGLDAAGTDWARQNLEADRTDGMGDPEPGDEPGVLASAVLDGTYPFRIDVVGSPEGDPLPEALLYGAGETYSLQLEADGSACPPTSCEVPVAAADGATGSADVGGGSVTVTFTQPIDCYDETRDNVVVPDIGTTTVTATLQVSGVAQDGTRWRIAAASGTGAVSTTLTTPCNPGDVLGTSTSATSVTAGG